MMRPGAIMLQGKEIQNELLDKNGKSLRIGSRVKTKMGIYKISIIDHGVLILVNPETRLPIGRANPQDVEKV